MWTHLNDNDGKIHSSNMGLSNILFYKNSNPTLTENKKESIREMNVECCEFNEYYEDVPIVRTETAIPTNKICDLETRRRQYMYCFKMIITNKAT